MSKICWRTWYQRFVRNDPEECIDCTFCVSACPIDAIPDEEELADELVRFMTINAEYALQWPVMDHRGTRSSDAAEWEDMQDKYPEHIDPKPAERKNEQ